MATDRDNRQPTDMRTTPTQDQYALQVENAARQMLAEAGISKPDDLMQGRADIGRTAEILARAGVTNPEKDPFVAEKALRDADFEEMAGSSAQPEPAFYPEPQPQGQGQDKLAEMQSRLEAAEAEAKLWKDRYGNGENVKGDLRRRLREIEERVTGQQPRFQPQFPQQAGYNPVMIGVQDPSQPPSAYEVQQALAAMATAFGNAVRDAREEAVREARALRDYDLSTDEEEDLFEKFPTLKGLPAGQREQLMYAIARPQTSAPGRPTGIPNGKFPPRPVGPTPEEVLRAKVRQTGFIEASSGAAPQERNAATAAQSQHAQRWKALQDALSKGDGSGSKEAEKILAAMGAGVVNDGEVFSSGGNR